jgi:hypothetical protein
MATLAELRDANAQIDEQMTEWKRQRFADGENPLDWVAFKQHLAAIGAPDPGDSPPEEFYRWDESMAGGQPSEAAATGESAAAAGRVADSGDTGT